MNSKLTKENKNLTKRPYTILLWAVGKNPKPLNGYQIKLNMQGSGSQDVYRMLKELAPSKYIEDKHLLYWEDFLENIENSDYKHDLIQKINDIFGLEWEVEKEQRDKEYNNALVRFEKGNDDKLIVIHHGSSNTLCIKLDQVQHQNNAYLTIFTNGQKINETLIIKKNKKSNKLGIYTRKYYPKPIRFLEVRLNEQAEKLITEIKNQIHIKYPEVSEIELETWPEVLEIKNDRDYWLYELNFRGLLLYFAGGSQIEDREKSNQRIRDVISNPIIEEKAPFLKNWQDFEKVGFDVIGILREIGTEFQSQIVDYNTENDYLRLVITERYYKVLSNYFYWFECSFFLGKNKKYVKKYVEHQIYNKLDEYHLKISKLQCSWLNKQIKNIDIRNRRHALQKNNDNLIKEVHDVITTDSNTIISIDELAVKYNMSNGQVMSLLTSMEYNSSSNRDDNYNGTHIIAGLHLIPNSRVASLLQVEVITRLKDTLLLLEKNGIPESCHLELIRKLGFTIIRKDRKTKNWNNYSNAIIVKRKEPSIKLLSSNQLRIDYN